MGKQETFSVTEIQRLCEASEYLDGTDLPIGDKTVSFDGHIIYYQNKKPKASGCEMFIPVQIKGKLVSVLPPNSVFNYPVSTRDLNNFFINGGVIYFVVAIEDSTKREKPYARILLPIDIKEIMAGKKQQNTITIQLHHIENYQALENLCSLFAQNKAKQGLVVTGTSCPDDLSTCGLSFSVLASSYRDPAIAIVKSPIKYIYAKYHGIEIPVNLSLVTTFREGSLFIETDSEAFYFPVRYVYAPDKNTTIISDLLQITHYDRDGKTTFRLLNPGDTPFNKVISISKFILAFMQSSTITVNHTQLFTDFSFLRERISKKFLSQRRFEITVSEWLNALAIPLEIFTAQEVFDAIDTIHKLKKALVDQESMNINTSNECGIYYQNIGNKLLVLEYKKLDDGTFSLRDYLRNESSIAIFDGGAESPTRISKWFAINPQRIVDTIFDRDVFIKDMIASDNDRDMDCLLSFVLKLLIDFDYRKNNLTLDFADKLMTIVEKKHPSADVIFINRMQIEYRKAGLTDKQKKQLRSIKRQSEDTIAKCCICILLHLHKEFNMLFCKLDEPTQELFKQWPIYNLMPAQTDR